MWLLSWGGGPARARGGRVARALRSAAAAAGQGERIQAARCWSHLASPSTANPGPGDGRTSPLLPFFARAYAKGRGRPSKRPAADMTWELDPALPKVAIVGRPNVGKSALYNRLVQRRDALVYNTPDSHVTRDHREGAATLGDLRFLAIDNAGLECNATKGSIQERAVHLARSWIAESDVAVLVIDARQGLIPQDSQAAGWLREFGPERVEVAAVVGEAHRLGLGEAVAVSAETGEGMADLYEALRPHIDEIATVRGGAEASSSLEAGNDVGDVAGGLVAGNVAMAVEGEGEGGEAGGRHQRVRAGSPGAPPLQLAILGRPNAGKSTLVNSLLGATRCLTGPEPGLTRDAVYARLEWEGPDGEDTRIWLIDTAGWMRRSRLEGLGKPSELSSMAAERSMQRAHVVCMVVDAAAAHHEGKGAWLTRPEMGLARQVLEEGRALVVLANKLDALSEGQRTRALASLTRAVSDVLPQAGEVPVLGISALTGESLESVLPSVMRQYEAWDARISTARLNRWLGKVAARHGGAGGSGEARIRYITQVKARPPTFVLWAAGAGDFTEPMTRRLAALIRADFGLEGIPIRISVRKVSRRGGPGGSRAGPAGRMSGPPGRGGGRGGGGRRGGGRGGGGKGGAGGGGNGGAGRGGRDGSGGGGGGDREWRAGGGRRGGGAPKAAHG